MTSVRDGGPGSLRQAIEDANRTPNSPGARDRIVFDIPGDGPHVISLAGPLPEITEAVLIDGYSQLGAVPAAPTDGRDALLAVRIEGRDARGTHGLVLRCGGAEIRGLEIAGFEGDAIRIEGGSGNLVTGNRLVANAGSGVLVEGEDAAGNAVLENSVARNARSGITLLHPPTVASGSGPNGLPPVPSLTAAVRVPGRDGAPDTANLEGTLTGTPGSAYRIDVYSTPATAAPSSNGPEPDDCADPRRREGRDWLGTGSVVLGTTGDTPFAVRLPRAFASRALITAVATDTRGNSSEFSLPIRAPQVTKSWNNAAGGNWSVGGNWTPNGAPGSTDDARIDLDGTYTVTLDVTTTVNSLVLGSATSGTQTLSIATATLTLNAASSVGTRGAVTQTGGTVNGAGSLTVNGAFSWNGGTWGGGGTTTLNNGLTVGGSNLKDLNARIVTVSGTVAQGGTGSIRCFSGSSLTNSGTWDLQSDAGIALQTGSPTFANNGTFKKSAGTATSTIGIAFNNTGSVSAQSGTVNFSGGGTHTGPWTGSAGSTLQFGGGTHDLSGNVNVATFSTAGGTVNVNSGSYAATATTVSNGTVTIAAAATVSAVGAITVSGGTVNFNSGETLSATSVTLSGGTLGGSDTVNASGQFGWTAGTLGGNGILNANGGAALSGSSFKDVNTRTLNLAGSSTIAGTGNVRFFGGTMNINAGATLDVQSDAGITIVNGTPLVTNNGTLRKSAGTGSSPVSVPFNNAGTVDIQSGTVNFSANGTHTGSFTGAAGSTLQFSGGTNDSGGNVNVAGFNCTAGTVNVNTGTFTATSTAISAGTVTFAAASTVSAVGALSVSGGTVNFNSGETITPSSVTLSGGTLGGSDTVNASSQVAWTGGTLGGSGILNANGGAALSGSTLKDLNTRTLNLAGNSTFAGTGNMRFFGGTMNINAGATFDLQSDAGLTFVNGTPLLTNNGTLRKSAGTGSSPVSVPFNNAGTVDIQSGTVNFSGNGTHTGSFTGAAGSTLQFSGGTHDSGGNVNVAGFSCTGATVNVNTGTFAATSTTISTGTVTFAAASTVSAVGALSVSGGTVNFNSGKTVTPSSVTLSGGTLGGSDTVNASSQVTWTAGALGGSGILNANGGAALSGSSVKDLNTRTLNLAGSSTITGTGSMRFFGGTMNINAGATLDLQADVGLNFVNGSPLVTNNGTLRKSGGTGSSSISVPFNNAGNVDIQSGTVNVSGNGTHAGSFTGAASTTLQFGGGTHDIGGNVNVAAVNVSFGTVNVNTGTFTATSTTISAGTATIAAASTVAAVGALSVSGGTLTFNSGETIAPTSLALSGGTLGGSDTVNVAGLFSWTGGTLGGTGTLNANGGASLSGSANKDISGRPVVFGGTSTMGGVGLLRFFGGTMTVAGGALFDIQADTGFQIINGAPTVTNNGTFRKSGGSGTSTIPPPFTSTGAVEALAGTLSFSASPNSFTQTAGTTTLNGGAITSTTAMAVQGGTLAGAGTVTGAVTSGGAVAPGNGIGVLNVTGNYVQQATGAFNPQIGGLAAGTQYDQLKVLGASTATLAGTLNVSLANGFVPVDGNAFSVLTFASATGTFSTLNFPALPQGCWLIAYRATDVQLSVSTRTPDVATVRFSNKTTLAWTGLDARFGTASYDVMRGATSQMPVGGKPGETCLAQSIAGTSFTDANQPAVGQSTYYLVRGKTPCGPGTWGTTSAGAERTPTVCP